MGSDPLGGEHPAETFPLNPGPRPRQLRPGSVRRKLAAVIRPGTLNCWCPRVPRFCWFPPRLTGEGAVTATLVHTGPPRSDAGFPAHPETRDVPATDSAWPRAPLSPRGSPRGCRPAVPSVVPTPGLSPALAARLPRLHPSPAQGWRRFLNKGTNLLGQHVPVQNIHQHLHFSLLTTT